MGKPTVNWLKRREDKIAPGGTPFEMVIINNLGSAAR